MDTWNAIFGGGPLFGFGSDCRAMSADEIAQMQVNQMVGTQTAVRNSSYLSGLAQYQPYQKPLDERFADFKMRLAAAVDRHKIGLAIPSQITPNQTGS